MVFYNYSCSRGDGYVKWGGEEVECYIWVVVIIIYVIKDFRLRVFYGKKLERERWSLVVYNFGFGYRGFWVGIYCFFL